MNINLPAPSHWPPINTPAPVRACTVCIYGAVNDDALMHCECYQVNGGQLTRCGDARSNNGACGPDARFLIVKGE